MKVLPIVFWYQFAGFKIGSLSEAVSVAVPDEPGDCDLFSPLFDLVHFFLEVGHGAAGVVNLVLGPSVGNAGEIFRVVVLQIGSVKGAEEPIQFVDSLNGLDHHDGPRQGGKPYPVRIGIVADQVFVILDAQGRIIDCDFGSRSRGLHVPLRRVFVEPVGIAHEKGNAGSVGASLWCGGGFCCFFLVALVVVVVVVIVVVDIDGFFEFLWIIADLQDV